MTEGDIEACDAQDFYGILNVPRTASEEDIRVAYKRLCVIFHPDKHESSGDRRAALSAYQKISNAYNVLIDPESRALYDVFGEKSLEMKMAIVPSRSHIKELQAEYEKIWRREKQLEKLHQLSPDTTLKVGFDVSKIGCAEDEKEESNDRVKVASGVFTETTLEHSKQYRLSTDLDVGTRVSLSSKNGVGIANFVLALQKVVNNQCIISANFSLNDIQFHPLDNRPIAQPACIHCWEPLEPQFDRACSSRPGVPLPRMRLSFPSFSVALQHSLSRSLFQVIEVGSFANTDVIPLPSEVGYSLGYKSSSLQIGSGFFIGRSNKLVNLHIRYLTGNFEMRSGIRISTTEMMAFNYGAMVYSHDRMSVSGFDLNCSADGVFVVIRYYMGKRKFLVPITISQNLSMAALLYGTVIPVVMHIAWKQFLQQPFAWIKTKIDNNLMSEEKRSHSVIEIDKKRRAAEKETNLMRAQAARNAANEKKRNGLVIQRAWYGQFDVDEEHPTVSDVCYPVTVQLQVCVNQSKLILNQGQSKSYLPGFYDPCPGKEKRLKIVYLFKCELHEAVFGDLEVVRIPKMSHRVEGC